jgi:predicted membrane protein
MENNNPSQNGASDDRRHIVGIHMGTSNIVGGLILVGIGVLFLLGNLHILRANDWISYWPVILIAIGLVQLVDSASSGGRIGGGVMLVLGALFLADNLGYLNFPLWQLWPLILIALGLLMLWNRPGFVAAHRMRDRQYRHWRWQDAGADYTAGLGGTVQEAAIFGGSKRVVTAQDFRRGHVSSIFGGITLDLTGAAMAEDIAVLHVSALYGGIVIRVPATWGVEVHGAGIFGGFNDQTVHPPAGPGVKRLIVKGAAIFGGVGIKN